MASRSQASLLSTTSSTLRLSQQEKQTREEAAIKIITSTFSAPKTDGKLNFLHL
jgi:hypothetical protein